MCYINNRKSKLSYSIRTYLCSNESFFNSWAQIGNQKIDILESDWESFESRIS